MLYIENVDTSNAKDGLTNLSDRIVKNSASLMENIYDIVVNVTDPLVPKLDGVFLDTLYEDSTTEHHNNFIVKNIIMNPYNENELKSKNLDAGGKVNTKRWYGRQAYFNNRSGTQNFFAVSLPESRPFIVKEIGNFVRRNM